MPLFLFTKINKKVEKIGLHKIPKEGGWVVGHSFVKLFHIFFGPESDLIGCAFHSLTNKLTDSLLFSKLD